MGENKKFDLIKGIVKRADELGLIAVDRKSLEKELKLENEKYSLRLDELLKEDTHTFSCVIVGIQEHIDRENSEKAKVYGMEKDKDKRYCNRCKNRVLKSDLNHYTYQCMECDEDLYEFETHEKESF